MGRNVNVEHGAYFGSGRLIEIGDNSGIGVDCRVPSNIRIGNDVMMGPNVLIIGRNHRFDDLSKPMRLQGFSDSNPVVIEDDVWFGARPGALHPKEAVCLDGYREYVYWKYHVTHSEFAPGETLGAHQPDPV